MPRANLVVEPRGMRGLTVTSLCNPEVSTCEWFQAENRIRQILSPSSSNIAGLHCPHRLGLYQNTFASIHECSDTVTDIIHTCTDLCRQDKQSLFSGCKWSTHFMRQQMNINSVNFLDAVQVTTLTPWKIIT